MLISIPQRTSELSVSSSRIPYAFMVHPFIFCFVSKYCVFNEMNPVTYVS